MKKLLFTTTLLFTFYLMSAQSKKTDTIVSNGAITVGQKAPNFTISKNSDLAALKGKKVALYFYPKDESPGCTQQACSLRDGYAQLKKEGWIILGISPDSEKSHEKFLENHKLPFPIISDTTHNIATIYGVWKQQNFMGKKYMGINRTTFLINENGIVQYIIQKIDVANHAQQILKVWNN